MPVRRNVGTDSPGTFTTRNDPARAPEWVYLFDQPGGNTRPIGESERVIVSQPATPNASAVRR